eukprot:Colp12_sorted_trinity150504_noHs@22400
MQLRSNRALLVVDGGYIVACKRKVDYMKMVQELQRELQVEFYERWFFNSEPDCDPQGKIQKFHHWLKTAAPNGPHFRVDLSKMKDRSFTCNSCKEPQVSRVQKGVDVAIAVEMMVHAYDRRCDTIVFVGGDGDFYRCFQVLNDRLHIGLHVVGWDNNTISPDLTTVARSTLYLDTIFDKIARESPTMQERPPSRGSPPTSPCRSRLNSNEKAQPVPTEATASSSQTHSSSVVVPNIQTAQYNKEFPLMATQTKELNTATTTTSSRAPTSPKQAPAIVQPSSFQQPVQTNVPKVEAAKIEIQKIQNNVVENWLCTKCNLVNGAKNSACIICAASAPGKGPKMMNTVNTIGVIENKQMGVFDTNFYQRAYTGVPQPCSLQMQTATTGPIISTQLKPMWRKRT